MTALRKINLISPEEYLAGERIADVKHEYTGGYVYAMAGALNVHNKIAVSFIIAIGSRLRTKSCQPFNSDTKVRVRMPTHTRFYYPDGMVVCQPNPDDDEFQDQPVVIAEVLSPSTRRIDEGEKREAYLTIPSLDAYLLIECVRPRVVVHRRTSAGFVLEAYEGLDAVIPLDTIGAELPLAELYERVDFAVAVREADEEREAFERG